MKSYFHFTFLSLIILVIIQILITFVVIFSFRKHPDEQYEKLERFAIDQPGCQIPEFSIFSSVVTQTYSRYLPSYSDLKCDKNPRVFKDDQNFLYEDKSTLKSYSLKDVKCEYSGLSRSIPGTPDDDVQYSKDKIAINDSKISILDKEFIEVKCFERDSSSNIYKDYFAFLPKKEEIKSNPPNSDSINTLIIGLDSVSRLQFRRQLNATSKFLKEELNAIEFNGYNKVADATYANLVAILTGLNSSNLYNECLKDSGGIADNCPLIFKKYQQNGFKTIFVEDAPELAIFNFEAKGFNNQPSDYYLRPLYLKYEKELGSVPTGCGFGCLGTRSSLEFLLGYAKKTAATFVNDKYFGFLWSCCCTHDSFKYDPHVDEKVSKFLIDLKNDQLLNNTVLILMADHGPRLNTNFFNRFMGKTAFSTSKQGRYERMLPFIVFVFPQWFEKKYKDAMINFRLNANRLTTHFDLHHTFYDFMNLTNIEKNQLERRGNDELSYGRSLFLPVSPFRKCYDANIPPQYCGCEGQGTILDNDNFFYSVMFLLVISILIFILLSILYRYCSNNTHTKIPNEIELLT